MTQWASLCYNEGTMKNADFLADEIFSRYGNVKRARGPFLYTAKGRRLTDLYQESGRAILGWGGCSAYTMLKNVLNRGATGFYRTDHTYRLAKAVNTLFPSGGTKRAVLVFPSKKIAVEEGLKISARTSAYHPWHQAEVDWAAVDCIVYEPTLPWAGETTVLAVRETPENAELIKLAGTRQIRLASPMEEAFARSTYDLITALRDRKEKDWFIYDNLINSYWTRKGPYLFPKVPEEKYAAFVLHCLDLGIVISPDYNQPSIVPFGADRGVFEVLKKNPFSLD